MSMRVQLNIDSAGRNLPNFIGSQNMQRSLRDQLVVIHAQLFCQHSKQPVFFYGRHFLCPGESAQFDASGITRCCAL